MNCQTCERMMSDLEGRRIMDAEDRNLFLAHVEECRACSQRLEDEQALTLGLSTLALEMNGMAAPTRIEEQVLSAFRNEGPVRTGTPSQRRLRYLGIAAAAVFLIACGIAAISWREAHLRTGEVTTLIPRKRENVAHVVPMPNVAENTSTPGSRITTESAAGPKKTVNRRRVPRTNSRPSDHGPNTSNPAAATLAANDKENEIATEFLPIGYMSPIHLQDGGQIVRVEVSRSALLAFGLPLNMDRYNERVKADVLLGSDGLARAIRFVQ